MKKIEHSKKWHRLVKKLRKQKDGVKSPEAVATKTLGKKSYVQPRKSKSRLW